MHEFLSERAGQLQRLATTIRTGLDQAESAIPSINQQLAELARLGMSDFQIEGPTIYCRPMGFSSMHGDEWVIYQAAIVMPGGIGASIWDATEYAEHSNRPYGDPVDLAPRFVTYLACPPLVRAMLVAHASAMLDRLMNVFRLLGS